MVKRIAFFNNKGDNSKTATIFHLGWMLATRQKKVLLVDSDPQCHLTRLVLAYKGQPKFQEFYIEEKERNLWFALKPVFESRPKPIEAVNCIPINGREGLYLLPGHIRLSEYEVTLELAQELSETMSTLRNLPGSISFILEKTAKKLQADYILIDMSPSLSSLNRNLLMTSHFFIHPTTPDYFSIMGIESLSEFLPYWARWRQKAASLSVLQQAVYPFPQIIPKFLGTIIQNCHTVKEAQSFSIQESIGKINKAVVERLVPAITPFDMLFLAEIYKEQHLNTTYCLSMIPDFDVLINKSLESQIPVPALALEQGNNESVMALKMERENLDNIFSELATIIIALTN